MPPARAAVQPRSLPEPRWPRKQATAAGSGSLQSCVRWMPAFAAAVGIVQVTAIAAPAANGTATTHDRCSVAALSVGGGRDAGPALQSCIDATPASGTIALPPGRYLIASPIAIRRPLTLTTRGMATSTRPCSSDERRCATLHLATVDEAISSAVMPVDIKASGVRLDHLVFEGTRRTNPRLSARRCASGTHRPMGGGVRINGNSAVIERSTFRDMACYTALEYGMGVDVTIAGNDFIGNGIHTALLGWADGLTIHGATRFRITGNRFRDNTDVQLILGSCTGCTIAGNRFRHGSAASGSSFAEIMPQAWPGATSGDFTGTMTTRNDIDCGPMLRCGFGIMIGSAPWYDAPAFGGTVVDNQVRQAMLALNVDSLTEPMTIERNSLEGMPGTYLSNCGPRRVDASANASPNSRRFLAFVLPHASRASYRRCILNYRIGSA